MGSALRFVWDAAAGWMVANLCLVVLQAGLPLVGLYLIKLVVDEVSSTIALPADERVFGTVLFLIAVSAGVALTTAVTRALAGFVTEAQSHLVTDHVTDILHEKSSAVDFAYYEDPRYYDTLHRAQQEAPYRPTRLIGNLTQVGQNGLTAVGIVILLATVHWVLAAVILVAVLPALLVRTRHAKRLHEWQREWAPKVRVANYLSRLLTRASHAMEIRLYDLGGELRGRFSRLRKDIRDERLRLARAVGVEGAASQIAASLVVFGSYAFIAWQTVSGPLTLGDLVMYFGAVQRGQSTLQSLFSSLGGLYEDNLFLSNLSEFMEIENRIVAPTMFFWNARQVRTGSSSTAALSASPTHTAAPKPATKRMATASHRRWNRSA